MDDVLPPCGINGHTRGHWEDDLLKIWWCPDCGTEIWLTNE